MEASIQHDETVHKIIATTDGLTLDDEATPGPAPERREAIEDKETEDKGEGEGELDRRSQKYRLAMIEKALSEARSVRSHSSAASIAPDVVAQRVRRGLAQRERRTRRKLAVAKGEASAATRRARDDRETIRESHGLWGWAD